MKRDFTQAKHQALLARTKQERRLEIALRGMLTQVSDPKELAEWLIKNKVRISDSTMSCIGLAIDHVRKLRSELGDGHIAYVIYGSVAREPHKTERHRDIDALVVTKRDIKLPRLYRRLNVQTIPKELLSDKNISKPDPVHLESKDLRLSPAALRRTFVLPNFALYDTNGFVEHVNHLAWKSLTMPDFAGYVDVHVANRLRLLRSAGKKITDRDEARIYTQVLSDLKVTNTIQALLLQHALGDMDE